MGYTLTAAPASEPITLDEAKAHCRIDVVDDDAMITSLIVVARRQAEQATERALITQTWTMKLDAFPEGNIEIPVPPLQSVTSITYVDDSGATQTLSPSLYAVHMSGMVGVIATAYGQTWPTTREQKESVTVVFVAGYGAASAVPADIRHWIILQVAHWYANREAVGDKREPLPFLDGLLDPYRVRKFS